MSNMMPCVFAYNVYNYKLKDTVSESFCMVLNL